MLGQTVYSWCAGSDLKRELVLSQGRAFQFVVHSLVELEIPSTLFTSAQTVAIYSLKKKKQFYKRF